MSNTSSVYLDFAAATPLDERVFAVMRPYLDTQFYNPSASYQAARSVRQDYEAARASLARCIGAKPHDIILTAGATESVNLAVQGVMKAWPEAKIALSATEHKAATAAAEQFPHAFIAVDSKGRVNEEALRAAVDDATVLVSVGLVNSEIGTVQPIKQLARTLNNIRDDRQRRGVKLPLYFHTDASQAAYTDLQVARLGVDLMTIGANKMYGPKQTGLLYAHRSVNLQPLIYGGGQERGLRSGTENVAGAVGFATALELACQERRERSEHVKKLHDNFTNIITEHVPEIKFTVPPENTIPHILHLSLPGFDGERLLYLLDERGVMVATGAACAANEQTGSHVLRAMGLGDNIIQGSIRCSFSHKQKYDEIKQAAQTFIDCVRELKEA